LSSGRQGCDTDKYSEDSLLVHVQSRLFSRLCAKNKSP
jgi:hypothetical protein